MDFRLDELSPIKVLGSSIEGKNDCCVGLGCCNKTNFRVASNKLLKFDIVSVQNLILVRCGVCLWR